MIGCIASSQHCHREEDDLYRAGIDWHYSSWVVFRINSSPEDIKSIKLFFLSHSLNEEKDFNVLVYHDISNRWPPASNSSADKLLLSYSSQREGVVELDLDPQDIDPDGYYVLEFRSDLQEYNCIPNPQFSNGKPSWYLRLCSVYPDCLEIELKE